jgi:hypothetical protein
VVAVWLGGGFLWLSKEHGASVTCRQRSFNFTLFIFAHLGVCAPALPVRVSMWGLYVAVFNEEVCVCVSVCVCERVCVGGGWIVSHL